MEALGRFLASPDGVLGVGLGLLLVIAGVVVRYRLLVRALERRLEAAGRRAVEREATLQRYAEELDRTRQRVEVLSALHHVVSAVSDAVDVRSILGDVTGTLARLVEAREVVLYTRDRASGALRARAHRVGDAVRFDEEVDPRAVDLEGVQRVVEDAIARSRAGAAWERVGEHVACAVLLEANREPIGAVRVVVPNPDGDAAALDLVEEAVREVMQPVALALEKPSLYDRAVYDPLTRMFNKRHYLEEMPRRFETARRTAAPLALVVLDIDHFKQVNDSYGHEAGDRVLAGVAETVRGCLRSIDLCFRYGGEELCVLLPDTSEEDAAAVAQRVRAAVEGRAFRDGKASIPVTISAGVAATHAEMAGHEALFAAADRALYASKEGGRNRVTCAAAGRPS